MHRGTVARIEDWDEKPFSGGYAGLHDLADEEFSGAVSVGGTWLFMLNGRVVGVFDGSLDGLEAAAGTAYVAPDPSLPLLFAMRERGGETRAKYYTDDTPLRQVDETLSEGGFTGYVELSENVLSGDYYLVYYGGRSLSAAFVGNEERLLTGEEAFERASEEVGIYEVRTVDLEVVSIPDVDTSSTGTVAPGPSNSSSDDATDDRGASDERGVQDENAESDARPASEPSSGDSADRSEAGGESDAPPVEADTDRERPATAAETEPAPDDASVDSGIEEAEPGRSEAPSVENTDSDGGPTSDRTSPDRTGRPRDDALGGNSAGQHSVEEDPFSEEEEWRETRTIPALDPDESVPLAESDDGNSGEKPPASDVGTVSTPSGGVQDDQRVRELRTALETYERRIDELEERLDETTSEGDRIRRERDQLRQRVSQLDADDGTTVDAGNDLDPTDALSRTDVFVRYGSKGRATLETARAGESDRDAVCENLRLETHTRFDDSAATVEGRPFDEFLRATLEHRFVRWLVEDLLYEIRDTGNQGGLRDLYDVIPRIDRAEFRGAVTSRDDDGEERRVSFDVVLRDRMGSPLLVADLNDARDPATDDMLSELVERATTVADAHESLGGTILVTASFFEPDALETASDATDVGILNRDARKSFVKLSRKRGYHLCLVEARGDEFHVAVPEL